MPFRRMFLLMAALGFVVILIQFGIISIAFEKLGLTRDSAYILLLTTLCGSLINLPLFSVTAEPGDIEPPQAQRDFYKMFNLVPPKFTGRTIIAVNVGGAVTPVAFSLYLFLHNSFSVLQVAGAVAAVATVAYVSSVPVRGIGIAMHSFLAPFVAAAVSIMLNAEFAAPLAYIGGTLGVLIGADLLRLGSIRKLGAPYASIGGAGSFDGIFLTGILAVLLA